VRTTTPVPTRRPRRSRSIYGYDPRWWGRQAADGPVPPSYWEVTRRPLPSLAFVLPLLLAYEVGVAWVGRVAAESARTGADAWMRQVLSAVGLTGRWLPPLALIGSLLVWQVADRRGWRFSPKYLVGMAAESLGLALALIGLSKVVDLGFAHMEGQAVLEAGGGGVDALVGYIGAGVYEEAIFRLALVPAAYGLLRLLQAPRLLAGTVTVTGSALLFSIAHHAGAPGEAFTWFAFIFRWLAGIYFAWVFVTRGFGIAVGTHAAYDILVGWLGWHF
jgi:hypothetical protein